MASRMIRLLNEGRLKLCAEQNKELSFASDRAGIEPLIRGVLDYPAAFEGALVGSRCLGLAAAYLLVYGRVATVDAELASAEAVAVLERENIPINAEQVVDNPGALKGYDDSLDDAARRSGGVALFVVELQRQAR